MPNAQLQRDARDDERSLRLRKFQKTVWIGACCFFIVLGLVISLLNAYNMGYGDAKSQTSLTQQESQRFRFLKRSNAVGIGVGAMVIFTGIVLLSRYGTMKDIAMLFVLGLIATPAAAQSDLCWRDPYPWIPGEWAGSGSVIEAGNRFQTVTRATVELWETTYKYDDARQNAIRHQMLPASLVETTLSDAHGAFAFKALERNKEIRPASFEIRVHMHGREIGLAYTEIRTGYGPQWVGRGIKVALSQEGKGCSRIYSAGLDDTDCGVLDCEKLPAGPAKIVAADGTPLADARLAFYRHSKRGGKDPEFTLTTDRNGMITTPAQPGCFDIAIEYGGSMHLCFSGQTASAPITVVLPPKPNR